MMRMLTAADAAAVGAYADAAAGGHGTDADVADAREDLQRKLW